MVLIIIGILGFLLPQSPFSITGVSTLSLDSVDLQSSYAPLNGQAWVYTFRQGGLGQVLQGRVDPAQAGQEFSGAEQPQNDFEMTVYFDDQKHIYDINQVYSYDPIYEAYITEPEFSISTNSCRDEHPSCGGAEEITYFRDALSGINSCYTICGTKLSGAIGELQNPAVQQVFEVIVKAKGETYAKGFDTLGKSNGLVGDNVYIEWQGNLESGLPVTSQIPYKAAYVGGNWRMIDSAALTQYQGAFDNLVPAGDYRLSEKNVLVEQLNNKMTSAIQSRTFANSFRQQNSVGDAQVVVIPQSPTQFTTITAYIKASWLGIYTPVGKPQIVSADSACFAASSDGIITTAVKNIGSETEIVNVYATCDNGFSSIIPVSISLSPAQTKQVLLSLSSSTDQRKTGECIIHADGIAEQDTQSVSVCVDPQNTCQPNTITCLNDDVVKCNVYGSDWETIQDCTAGCGFTNEGQAYCKESTPPESIPPSIPPKSYVPLIIAIIAALLLGVGGVKLGKKSPYYYVLIVLSIIALIIAIIGVFALASGWSAIFVTIGLILITLGASIMSLKVFAEYGLVGIGLGIISMLIGILIFVFNTTTIGGFLG